MSAIASTATKPEIPRAVERLLMEVATANAINTAVYPNLNYNFIREIAPVASIGIGAYVMVIHPSIPAKTVPEFIAYAKANPGKIDMASAGNGTATRLFGALFMTMAGIDMVHVPYRGSFIPDLLGGQVQIVFGPIAQLIEHIRAGKLRPLQSQLRHVRPHCRICRPLAKFSRATRRAFRTAWERPGIRPLKLSTS